MDQDEINAQKLAELAETFNTNPGFGLMGMLDNRDPQAPEQQQQQVQPKQEDTPPEWVDMVNSRVESTNRKLDEQFNRLSEMVAANQSRQSVQPITQEPTEPLDPVSQEIMNLRREQQTILADTVYERAKNSLQSLKQRHPDATFTEQDLQTLWKQHDLTTNINQARGLNWDQHWENEYQKIAAPKKDDTIKQLQEEIAALKSGRSPAHSMAALPRSNRSAAPAPGNSQSGDFDEDVYQAAKKRMTPGKFMGFNRILMEEQRKKSLRTAV